ncbi:MAG: tetratricopeptide repeat protein [Alphaproteobacteria bacterium]
MTTAITTAHVCGPLGQALAVVDGETWLYEIARDPRPPTSNDIRLFFDHGLEVRSLEPAGNGALTLAELPSILSDETSRFRALRGLLIGMDSEVDDELRQMSMRRADSLLAKSAVAEFVTRRFFRPLDREAWDVAGAIRIAKAAMLSAAGRLYEIVDGPLLPQLDEVVASWALTRGQASVERAHVRERAYDSNLIATAALALHDGDKSRIQNLIFLAKASGWNPHLVTYLVSRFAPADTPSAIVRAEAEDDDGISAAHEQEIVGVVRARVQRAFEAYRSRRRQRGHRSRNKIGGLEALDPVLKQVEWIATQFKSSHVNAAWNAVAELAERQLREADPEKLAKSLTNLATRGDVQGKAALDLCDLAAMCAPDDPFPRTGRAETLRAMGRYAEALASYDRTVEEFPGDVVARNGRAETLRAMGRYAEALASYDRTVEEFPGSVVARNGRAEMLRAMGRYAEALASYDRTVEEFPGNVIARSGRAEMLRAMGRYAEALASYDRTVEEFPGDVVARNGRAETLRAMGRYAEALASYDGIAEEFPGDVVARSGRAETLRAMGRLGEALLAYRAGLRDFPFSKFIRNGYATVLCELGQLDDARSILKDVDATPKSQQDWVAAHILCMIDLRSGATPALAERLQALVATCPYREERGYFETTLVVVRIAMKRATEARESLTILVARPEFEPGERAGLHLIKAHAEAADNDPGAARHSLAVASQIYPYELFHLRRLQQEIERRFGLGSAPPLTRPDEIASSEEALVRLEVDFWVARAARARESERLVA